MSSLHYLILDPVNNEGRLEYYHGNRAAFSSAYEKKEEKSLRITVPRSLGATEMLLDVFDESGSALLREIKGTLLRGEAELEVYTFRLDLDVGLYYATPKIKAYSSYVEGRKLGNKIVFDGRGDKIQISVSDFLHKEPESIYGGIIYHVFVDRFARGGKVTKPDYAVVVDGEWDVIPEYPEYPGAHLKNNTFYGGTLYGIIDKLDYISSLGVSALYLSPIFESVSNHKYDTADYLKVDAGFGGDAALKKLIREADKRKIKIILDGVFNHTGSDSVYFNRNARYDSIGAYQSKNSEYFEWYDFQNYPDKYTCWWDIEILPRINPDNPSCGDFFVKEGGVISKYRDMGVYGFRLDVADELSDGFIEKIKETSSKNGDSILYGEVWEDASNKIAYGKRKQYYLGKELDGVMNYPLRKGLIDYVCNKDASSLRYVFDEVFVNTPERILHAQMNFLGTHDTERILTVLGCERCDGMTNAELSVKRMNSETRALAERRLAGLYTVLATLPGIPTVFYGDEAGLEGYKDPFNRMPYPWGKESHYLLDHYKRVGVLRRQSGIYSRGNFRLIHLDSDLLVFARYNGAECFISAFNNSFDRTSLTFEKKALECLSNEQHTHFELAPYETGVFKTTCNNGLFFSKAN